MARHAVYICGGSRGTARERDEDCPNTLHDWPTPPGILDACDEAGWRLRNGWANPKCPHCGRYGWRPGKVTEHHIPRPAANHA